MMEFLFTLHSHNRWLVFGMGIAAIIKFFLVWQEHLEFGRATRIIYAIFSGFLGIQVIVGLILLFSMGFERWRIEHGTIMILAFALAHFPFKWKALGGELRAKRSMFVIIGVMALILLGIYMLPQEFSNTTKRFRQNEPAPVTVPM
jgi:hypothetical protein